MAKLVAKPYNPKPPKSTPKRVVVRGESPPVRSKQWVSGAPKQGAGGRAKAV